MYLDSVDNDDLNQQLHNTEYLNDLRQQMIKFALLQLSSFLLTFAIPPGLFDCDF